MENNTRRILILNRLNSRCIEQAIFILRDGYDASETETDAVAEAQKIVDSYISEMRSPLGGEKQKHRLHPVTSGVLLSIAVMICTFLTISLLR